MVLASENFMSFSEFAAQAKISRDQFFELVNKGEINVQSDHGMSYIVGTQRTINHARACLGLGSIKKPDCVKKTIDPAPIRKKKKNPYL